MATSFPMTRCSRSSLLSPLSAASAHVRPSSWLPASRVARRRCCFTAAATPVGAEAAKRMIEKDGYKVLDVRSVKAYDESHITKPALSSFNVPLHAASSKEHNPHFVTQVASKFPSKSAKLIVMCESGSVSSDQAVKLLQEAAYVEVWKLEGGYAAWTEVWTPSGKRRPPPGRWVSTGKEALKSGLNIPGVAESYDEGGNLVTARWAKGLPEDQGLP